MDQGSADDFLPKQQLLPETLVAAANEHKQTLQYNLRVITILALYDHITAIIQC